MKKESLQTTTVKTLLAVLLFAGVGIIIIGGGYIIGEYSKNKANNKPAEKEITITTDKTKYEQGEEVKITIRNNSSNSIWHRGDLHNICHNAFYIGVKQNNYKEFHSFASAYCLGTLEELKSHSSMVIKLNPKEDLGLLIENESMQFPATYKLKFEYYNKNINSNSDSFEIYSGEFTIKEKIIQPDTSNWQTYQNEEFGFEVKLPSNWKAYSEYDRSVIASSAKEFPNNPLILTGIPPDLNFQIEIIQNMNLKDYQNNFFADIKTVEELQTETKKTGLKLYRDNDIFFLIQIEDNLLKIFSNKNYLSNDQIFSSIKFTEN